MTYLCGQHPQGKQIDVRPQCSTSSNHTPNTLHLNSKLIVLILSMMMISTAFGLRLNHDQQPLTQRVFSAEDQTFKFRVFCPYSFLARSKSLITENTKLDAQQKANLLSDTYLTTLKVNNGSAGYNYNTTFLVEVRSIATLGANDTIDNHLYYCGLARNYYGECQNDVKFACTRPGSMFDVLTYQHIDVAFVNLLNPLVVPNPWEVNHHVGAPDDKIKSCFDPTMDDQQCEIYQKTDPLQTFSDPTGMHKHAKTTTAKTSEKHQQQDPDFIRIRLNPNNWPISTHIHGLQVRPTMDGHPQSWVSNVGQRGTGAFSSQDQCYYSSFDTKESYTQKMKANGSPPPVMTITDAKGYDITNVAKINRYPNAQSPGNLWYHDHAMRLTNYNAISGLAGYYILRSLQTQKQINVPKENEVFLLISSTAAWQNVAKGKFRGGQVYRFRFLNDLPDSEYNISFTHSSCALNTPESKIKFTMIGTDASLFDRGIENLSSFTISSGERLELLIKLNDVFANFDVCSQERQGHSEDQLPPTISKEDSILDQLKHPEDFKGTVKKPVREEVANTSAGMAEARTADNPYTGRREIVDVVLSVPYTNLSLVPEGKIKVRKMRSLNYLYHAENLFGIHGRSDFHKGWSQEPEIGTIQDYFFINLSNVPHPIHVHLVMFQVLKEYTLRTYTPPAGGDSFGDCSLYEIDLLVEAFKALLKNETTINRILKFHMGRVFRNKMTIINYDYICYNRKYFYEEKTVSQYLNLIFPENSPPVASTRVHGINVLAIGTAQDVLNSKGTFNVTLKALKYVTNAGSANIKPEHSRWKDTVFLKAPRIYQFRIRWTKNDYEEKLSPKDTYFSIPLDQLRQYPGFVYHCHIIHHEDYEMMRPIMLKVPSNLKPNQCIDKATPCNFNATTNKYNLNWQDKYQCVNDRCKAWASKQPSLL